VAVTLWVKQLAHDADRLPVSASEINNLWICSSTLSFVFMAQCLTGQFDFTLQILNVVTECLYLEELCFPAYYTVYLLELYQHLTEPSCFLVQSRKEELIIFY
jgi:hypothetical protein